VTLDQLLFGYFPYLALLLAIVVTAIRWRQHPYSVTSLSSQLLERRKLAWGSTPFHLGILVVLAGHLVAFLFPRSVLAWNGEPVRLVILQVTALAFGLFCLFGLAMLIWRRASEPRLHRVTSAMDAVVLGLLLVSVVTGLITSIFFRWGTSWFAEVASPYLWSLVWLDPRPELLAGLPFFVQVHIFNSFLLLAVFPFTRLVHAITVPLGYLARPWQIVIANRRGRGTVNR